MLTEHDVLAMWRQLFQDHEINDSTMAEGVKKVAELKTLVKLWFARRQLIESRPRRT